LKERQRVKALALIKIIKCGSFRQQSAMKIDLNITELVNVFKEI